MTARANFAATAFAVARRAIRATFTNPALLLPSLIFPLFFFTAFAGGISGIESAPGFDYAPGYTAFVFVFVLLQAAAFGGVFTGFSIARDFEVGFARRLFLAARRREAVVAGYAMAALVRALFTMSVVTTIALATGMQVGGDGVDLFGLYGLAILVNVVAVMWAAGVAMRLRTLQGGPAMQVPVFLTLFLAPVYVPLSLLSGWVHAVATVNPVTAIMNAGRDLMAGSSADILLAVAITAALMALMGVWALRSLRSAEAAGA